MSEAFKYSELVQSLRKVFTSGKSSDLNWRKEQLKKLFILLEDEKDAIAGALKDDLGKPYMESIIMEIDTLRGEVVTALDNIDSWTAPEKVSRNLITTLDTAYTQYQPLGVVLVIGAWNYPIQLTIGPLIGALAAGNCVVVKPSEISPNSAALLEKLLGKYLDPDCVKIVNGGVKETTELLKERFDSIFFTGSTNVGKIVYEAAVKNLTPVTLELGGKSPTIVDETSDLKLVARRVLWGKLANAGQTCIAPDYLLCAESIQDKMIEELKNTIKEFYGDDIKNSTSFGRIVNINHFNRLKKLLSSTEGSVAFGGDSDEKLLFISPTILTNVRHSDPVMQEEIFGPILPILTVKDVGEAIEFVNSRPKPLVVYAFSKNNKNIQRVVKETQSGSVVANDVFVQMSLTSLPFGGVGMSGFGASHGKYSFEAFSHKKACLIRAQNMEFVNDIRYPPYSDKKLNFFSKVLSKKPKSMKGFFSRFLPFAILGMVLGTLISLILSNKANNSSKWICIGPLLRSIRDGMLRLVKGDSVLKSRIHSQQLTVINWLIE